MEPYYDPSSKLCSCTWIQGLQPSQLTTTTPLLPEPTATMPCVRVCPAGSYAASDPATGICSCITAPCPSTMVCIPEKHIVYNPSTGACTCEWIPGLGVGANNLPRMQITPSAIIPHTTSLIPSSIPTGTNCTASCISGYFPVGDGTCSCTPGLSVPSPTPTPTLLSGCSAIKCMEGFHAEEDSFDDSCHCVQDEHMPSSIVPRAAVPTGVNACSYLHCNTGLHAQANTTTGFCQCVADCPSMACVSEQWPVYNETTGYCSCQWKPGFGFNP